MSNGLALIELGVGGIAVLGAWWMIRRTMADLARDELFALRDRMRAEFERRGLLGSETYSEVRLVINSYIYNIDQVSLFSILLLLSFKPMRSIPKVQVARLNECHPGLIPEIEKAFYEASTVTAKSISASAWGRRPVRSAHSFPAYDR